MEARKRKILNLNLLKDDGKKKRTKAKRAKVKTASKILTSDVGNGEAGEDLTDNTVLVDDLNEGEDVAKDDIFTLQFMYELKPSLQTVVSSKPLHSAKHIVSWPTLGNMIFAQPDVPEDDPSTRRNLLEASNFASTRPLPQYSEKIFSLRKLCIKSQIMDNIEKACQIENIQELTPLQKELMTLACNYHMDRLLRPERLDMDPNSSHAALSWNHWFKTFENFINGVQDLNEAGKLNLLINHVAPSMFSIFSEATTYTDAVGILKSAYVKPTNEIFARHKLATTAQSPNETIDQYFRHLQQLGKECKFEAVSAEDVYFPEMTLKNGVEIRLSYCTHVVNHVLKSRLKIIHHNAKLTKKDDVPEEFRDQGLVRPKVLILLPLKDCALKVVKTIINILLGEGGHVMNKKRFIDEYSGDTIKMPQKNPRPLDYQELFSGNTDDNFKIGLSVTKKCVKLFSDFYTSDIVIASPLGLRMLIGSKGERTRAHDFLASIEVLVMDHTQVMVMQNWEHVLHVINHLHLQPKDSHGTDLSRVRMWALNGCSRYYMQSLIFSHHPTPEITALFNSKFANYAGKVTIANPIAPGSMSQVALQVPQVFHHVKSATVSQAVDDRFETFISDILPQYKDPSLKHTLIYIPSYFDFVRLRNYLKKEEYKFVHICEYTEESKITRARNKIFHGETQILLYTERFHFYRRIKLRGIQNIIFYQPPVFPHFYSELCNFIQDVNKLQNNETEGEAIMTVNVLYTKFDVTQIAAIVGTERATRMLASDKPTHMFMTDT